MTEDRRRKTDDGWPSSAFQPSDFALRASTGQVGGQPDLGWQRTRLRLTPTPRQAYGEIPSFAFQASDGKPVRNDPCSSRWGGI